MIAVEGRSVVSWADDLLDAGVERPILEPGVTLVYRVERAGRSMDVSVTLGRYAVFSGRDSSHPIRLWGGVALLLACFAVAIYVFLRRPRNPATRAMIRFALLAIWAGTWQVTDVEILDLVRGPGPYLYLQGLGPIAEGLAWGALLHFILVFPRPRPVLRSHPGLPALLFVAPVVLDIAWLAIPFPRAAGALGPLYRWIWPMIPRLLSATVTPVLLISGYRWASDVVDRRRLRWLVVTLGGGMILYLLIWIAPALAIGRSLLPWELQHIVFLPAPFGIVVGVLRGQAFDIKVAINRTLVYGFLTICVVGIYVTTVGMFTALLGEGAGVGFSLPGLVAAALVAAAFGPLRVGLQRGVNRLLYGDRDEPYKVVSRLGRRLEATLDSDEMLPVVVETVGQALRLPYAAVELKDGDRFRPVAQYGESGGESVRLPLTYHGEMIGQLALATRGPAESFSPADRNLLEDLARLAGVAAHAVRLTADLRRSRQRLVTEREKERRRLGRDLHDGLGSALSGISLQLAAIGSTLGSDPEGAERGIRIVQDQTRDTIRDIRRLVNDLRPPALDQRGLAQVLREQAATFTTGTGVRDLQVSVEVPETLPSLPAAVEVAVYRIAREALTNVARHARARACTLRITLVGAEVLELEVRDDGDGLPKSYRPGHGLASMRERAAELGGACAVEPAPEGGTIVRARLPLLEE